MDPFENMNTFGMFEPEPPMNNYANYVVPRRNIPRVQPPYPNGYSMYDNSYTFPQQPYSSCSTLLNNNYEFNHPQIQQECHFNPNIQLPYSQFINENVDVNNCHPGYFDNEQISQNFFSNYYNDNVNSIVFNNDDEIPIFEMEDDCDYAFDNMQNQAPSNLLHIDYNVSNGISSNLIENNYWQRTHDRDYRFQENVCIQESEQFRNEASNFQNHQEKNLIDLIKNIRNKSAKKKKRKMKRQKRKAKLKAKKSLKLDDINDMSVEELIKCYNQIKEEITLLNCDDEDKEVVNIVDNENDGHSLQIIDEILNTNNIEVTDEIKLSELESNHVDQNDNDEQDRFSEDMEIVDEMKIDDQINDADQINIMEQLSKSKLDSVILSKANSNQTETDVQSSSTASTEFQSLVSDSHQSSPNEKGKTLSESLLREQLIRSLLEKRITRKPASKQSKNQSPAKRVVKKTTNVVEIPSKQIQKPKIDLSKYRLVIQLSEGESSSDSDSENINASTRNTKRLSKPNGINTLMKSQQEEYQKLKSEIERRESQTLNAKKLSFYEMQLKELILNNKLQMKSMAAMKRKMIICHKRWKKSQLRMKKLYKLYLLSNKNSKSFFVQYKLAQKEIQNHSKSVKGVKLKINEFKSICQNLGTKLHGNDYAVLRAINISTEDSTQNIIRKRLESFNEIKESLSINKSKQMMHSLKYLKSQVSSFLKSSYSYESINLCEHYLNFNFTIIKATLFYETSKLNIEFNDFTENRNAISSFDLNKYPSAKIDDHFQSNYQSVLAHFNSYRFASHYKQNVSADHLSNSIDPNKFICNYELFGVCNDTNCQFQHQKDYIYNAQEKVIDILTYLPNLAEDIDLDKLKNDPKLLKRMLIKYAKIKLENCNENVSIEDICRSMADDIQIQSKISISSLLIRLLPKELINFSENVSVLDQEVPFDDYNYKFNIKDDSFELDFTKVHPDDKDPDLYLKNRFFAPEGIPISAQMEKALSTDLHNIQMWIKLAYHHLNKFHEGQFDIGYHIDSALNVLTRALEVNKNCSELYEHYLHLYSNKLDLISNTGVIEQNDDIQQICCNILDNCSTYQLWICYLNLSYKLEDKESISRKIIDAFTNDKILYDDVEQRSFNLLEIILYRINLYIHLNKPQDALEFFNKYFNVKSTNEVASIIIKKHRVFAWLCYIHLVLYRCLPIHCFLLSKRNCFIQMLNAKPFVFDWKTITSQNDLSLIEKILKRALKSCCSSDDDHNCDCTESNCFEACFPLRLNLFQLSKHISSFDTNSKSEQTSKSFLLPFFFNDNREVLSHLETLHIFEKNLSGCGENGASECLQASDWNESFHNSSNHDRIVEAIELDSILLGLLQHQLKSNYWSAFYNYKFGENTQCKQILLKNIVYYYQEDIVSSDQLPDDSNILKMYECVLFIDCHIQDPIRGKRKFKNDKRSHQIVYLYLSYL